MKKIKILLTLFCVILVVSMPVVFAVLSSPQSYGPYNTNQNPYSTPASQRTDPLYGGNLGGYVYSDPYQEEIRRATGGYSYGQEQYLGEAIIVNVADYDPKQVRESALEQQDLPVFIYLKGTTVGTLLSPLTTDPTAQDPLSGITNIPPIDYIDVKLNSSS